MTNEEKIMKELREKGGKLLTDYNLLKTDNKDRGDSIIIGENGVNDPNNESGHKNHPGFPPESSPESSKPGCWWKVILAILGPILFIFIFSQIQESGVFQRTVNPQKYWRKQVATLEDDIYKTQLYIKDWEDYSIEKDKSFLINYDSLVRKLIIEGKEPEDAEQIASDTIKEMDKVKKETDATMLKMREEMLEHSYKALDDSKRQLEQAKKELSKYQ